MTASHITCRGIDNVGYASLQRYQTAQNMLNYRYAGNFERFGRQASQIIYDGYGQTGKDIARGLEQRRFEQLGGLVGTANRQNPVGQGNARKTEYLNATDEQPNTKNTGSKKLSPSSKIWRKKIMPLVLEESEKKINLDGIRNFEITNKLVLPKDFIDFYLINNGGYLPEADEPNPYLLGGFFSFIHGKLPIEKRYKELLEDWPNLLGMIPFAYDDGGNLFLISTVPESYGEVKIWLTDEKELDTVSSSFLSYINELKKN